MNVKTIGKAKIKKIFKGMIFPISQLIINGLSYVVNFFTLTKLWGFTGSRPTYPYYKLATLGYVIGNPFFLALHVGNLTGFLITNKKTGLKKTHIVLATFLNFLVALIGFIIVFSQYYYAHSETFTGTGTAIDYGVSHMREKNRIKL